LQAAHAFVPLAFHGGTALRLLYRTPRYSEDLDFALEHSSEEYELRSWLRRCRQQLTNEGYRVDIRVNDQRVVHSAWLRFRGLYYDLGLSPHADEVLAIKMEVDTRPPAGAGLVTTVVRRYVLLHLQHHDRASLFAGKLHALLQRPYLKGRDVFDLFWYLADPDWPEPNLTLLNNALIQTDWPGDPLTASTWREAIWGRLQNANWSRVRDDVRPFLEPSADGSLLERENLRRLLFEQAR